MEVIAVFSNKDRADGLGWEFQPTVEDIFSPFPIGSDGLRSLWIVYDKIENPSLFIQEKLLSTSVQRVYVLYHQNPLKPLIAELHNDLENKGVTCFLRDSDHETPIDYKKIVDFMENDDESELVELFDELKHLISRDKKMKFCTDCSTFENFPSQPPEWVEGLALTKFETLKKIHQKIPFNQGEFIEIYGELREALLED